jgi:hypothetical protein
MIKNWTYNNAGGRRDEVKNFIKNNNLKTLDIGATANYWSYPECTFVADSYPPNKDNITYFQINLENKKTWEELRIYVKENGKFKFTICSHTLEDVFNPIDVIEFLQEISESGFVAMPSKYDEFSKLYDNDYLGNAHHKQFFDIKNDILTIYPKFSWIEKQVRSKEIEKNDNGREISFYWEKEIPYKIFGEGKPFGSDSELINNFYNELID